jgi:hypothetical protein
MAAAAKGTTRARCPDASDRLDPRRPTQPVAVRLVRAGRALGTTWLYGMYTQWLRCPALASIGLLGVPDPESQS